MTASDTKIIAECLKATAEGPFIPEWEFDTLMGVSKVNFEEIAARWPNIDMQDADVRGAVSNCLLNLAGYPIDSEERWHEYVSVSRDLLDGVRARFEDLPSISEPGDL